MRKSNGRKSTAELGRNKRTTNLSDLRAKDVERTKARTITGGAFGGGGGAGKVQMQDFHFMIR